MNNFNIVKPTKQIRNIFTKSRISIMRDLDPFISNILMGLEVIFVDESMDKFIAATDGLKLIINIHALTLPIPEVLFILLHETLHVGLMHVIRKGDRDRKIWNYACDYVVNLEIKDNPAYQKYVRLPQKIPVLLENRFKNMTVEQVYEDLLKSKKVSPNSFSNDVIPSNEKVKQKVVNKVIQAGSTGFSTADVAAVQEIINNFRKPQINWATALKQYLIKATKFDYTFSRPNRRFITMGHYFPSLHDISKLESLTIYLDTSGSMTHDDLEKVTSELLAIHKLQLVDNIFFKPFDTQIRDEIVIDSYKTLTEIDLSGRGGTSLQCVYRDIIASNKPENVYVIMSDMHVTMMKYVNANIIWLVLNNKHVSIPFGKVLHIQ